MCGRAFAGVADRVAYTHIGVAGVTAPVAITDASSNSVSGVEGTCVAVLCGRSKASLLNVTLVIASADIIAAVLSAPTVFADAGSVFVALSMRDAHLAFRVGWTIAPEALAVAFALVYRASYSTESFFAGADLVAVHVCVHDAGNTVAGGWAVAAVTEDVTVPHVLRAEISTVVLLTSAFTTVIPFRIVDTVVAILCGWSMASVT
jgi:hypothetical protein